ncbi:ABC transporter permease [Spirulina subsalsa FACHB-351]|uniref:ABC transporter permease n=1 Tax=Spirulina subsalsa FACHB-351 TaxID=234711 RepID=A0ABT3LCU2_9CYAN|nr:ABC transporter permease [Spirulina subsalsa]MCW6038952.1 ABC transporter permease [Spirulina subsalsa FACHB-351]
MTVTQDFTWRDRLKESFSHLKAIVTHETVLYVLKRLLQGMLTLFLASVMIFFVMQFNPGNPADRLLYENPNVSEDVIRQYIDQFALDQPWFIQHWRWFWNVLSQFNFGYSFVYSVSVQYLIVQRMAATLLLSIPSIIITWAIALPLGIVGAVQQNQLTDRVLRVLSYLGQGFPSFITCLVLLFVAQITSPLFPVGGMTSINHADLPPLGKVVDIGWHMILPTIALSITSFAGLQRLTRGSLLDVLRQEYIQTARAKGLPENRVIYVHALRNAINPLVTILGFEFASLLSGSFIAEFFFSWPGLGSLILEAVMGQDVHLAVGGLMMGATMLILGNLLADLLLRAVDPRIRLENLQ